MRGGQIVRTLWWAGLSFILGACDGQGESVGRSDAEDAALFLHDAAPAPPDAAPAPPDAAPAQHDAEPAQHDAAPTQPDATPAQPDAAPVQPDAAPAQPDAAPAQPDAAPAQPDAAPAQHDAAPAQPDAAPAQPDAAPAQPDAAPAQPDAAPLPPEIVFDAPLPVACTQISEQLVGDRVSRRTTTALDIQNRRLTATVEVRSGGQLVVTETSTFRYGPDYSEIETISDSGRFVRRRLYDRQSHLLLDEEDRGADGLLESRDVYTYDMAGHLLTLETDDAPLGSPDGLLTQTFDARGRMLSQREEGCARCNGEPREFNYGYDEAGRWRSITRLDLTGDEVVYHQVFRYDAGGRLLSETMDYNPARHEGRDYAQRLDQDGVRVAAVHHNDQMHGVLSQGRLVPAGRVIGDQVWTAIGHALHTAAAEALR